ncbi:hypothetical protein CBP36_21220 (plasmid) [Acidovorax carolinensis]|uniref:CobQ/CobB/MinD/ParA nucleotide binding domain-containing protein n=1 Tax=Acidovorax carolinensis TaxID=553814 RepID=A0A240UKE3_9BURK|nr:hypothetical protein [Acidovorax carolinensis]ART61490.1 hypothetical protein CBP36_21220 [Acidovorax carolinensis]
MSSKTVWMVSGNKGGVGKSLFCLALASAFEASGLQYAVFDGDGRTGDVFGIFNRKCPARQGDFRSLRPESHLCSLDREYETLLKSLLAGSPHLIVNTPDGADAVLKKWFDVTLAHTEASNINFRFIYLMSDRPDGLDMLPQLAQSFQFLYPVRNLHFGNERLFSVFNQRFMDGFKIVLDFPALRGEEVRMLFDLQTYPAEILKLKSKGKKAYAIPAVARARIHAWQNKVNELVWGMVDNTDMPNLEFGKW